jgi:phosphoribosylaminoimidazolecarboxamide formyltransferase/IMP cyclohydrolase
MTDHPRRVTRALLSVSDKTGLTEFAKALASHGVELVSTGGTAKAIAAAGLQVKDVSELTGFPEMMDGRVKTLHPKVHGGLLAIRDNKEHADAMKAHGIAPIDLLVVNLYPFEETVDKGAGYEDCIENIDIGGPAMIRAAAKNHDDVAVVVEAQDYQAVLDELAANKGATSLKLRRRLAAKAYARTAAYDAAISNWFALQLKDDAPDFRAFGGRLIQSLRYGENPHQTAAFYATPDKRPGVATARQLQGRELSYNNINDTDAAYECIAEFDPKRTAACVIVKHANPCGAAEASDSIAAWEGALAGDPVSAFGGVLVPIIIWIVKKDSPVVSTVAKQAVLLNVSVYLAIAVTAILLLTIVLIPIVILAWVVLGIVAIVLPIVGAIRANDGWYYRYPVIGLTPDVLPAPPAVV